MSSVNQTPIEFPFEPRSQSGQPLTIDQLKIKVEGPKEVENVQFKKDADGNSNKIKVFFVASFTGDYTIHITDQAGEAVQNTPIKVHVKVKSSGDDHPQIQPIPAQPEPTAQRHPVKFQVEAKDQQENPISDVKSLAVSVSGPETISKVDAKISDGLLFVIFETTRSDGEFSVSVKHNGLDIFRSPFNITLSKHTGPDPVKEFATMDN